MPASDDANNDKDAESAREVFQMIKEVSDLLETNLDSEALRYCIRLCENGVNPETLANIVLELQKAVEYIKAKERFSTNGSGDAEKL